MPSSARTANTIVTRLPPCGEARFRSSHGPHVRVRWSSFGMSLSLNRFFLFGRTLLPNIRKRTGVTRPRTQNPVQYWQLRSSLSVEQAARRIGIPPDRYGTVVVLGTEHFTEAEIRKV